MCGYRASASVVASGNHHRSIIYVDRSDLATFWMKTGNKLKSRFCLENHNFSITSYFGFFRNDSAKQTKYDHLSRDAKIHESAVSAISVHLSLSFWIVINSNEFCPERVHCCLRYLCIFLTAKEYKTLLVGKCRFAQRTLSVGKFHT